MLSQQSFSHCVVNRMAGKNNLNPPIRSADEAREKGKKGGIASGEARRKKKTIRETLEMVLAGKLPGGETRQEAIVFALMEKALSGDVRAFEVIRDSIGEKPSDKVDVRSSDGSMTPKAWTPKDVANELISQLQAIEPKE